MIGKVITGRSFGGCVRYVVGKPDAVILEAAGLRTQKVSQIIADFNLQRKFNPGLGKAVGHIALSWSASDAVKLTNELMLSLAKEYLEKMQIRHTQYLVVKHQDTGHPHLHIVYNRVDNRGKTISDQYQRQRNVQVTKEMTEKHGFYLSPGKENVNRERLKGRDKVKYELYDAIKLASKKVKNITELQQVLVSQGITLHFKYKGGSTDVQGISFSNGEYKFKGSEIDRSMSYERLRQTLADGQRGKQTGHTASEKSLAEQLRKAVNHNGNTGLQSRDFQRQEQQSPELQNPELQNREQQTEYTWASVAQYPDTLSDGDYQLIEPGLDIQISDDIDDEAILGRNRHRKRKARTNTR